MRQTCHQQHHQQQHHHHQQQHQQQQQQQQHHQQHHHHHHQHQQQQQQQHHHHHQQQQHHHHHHHHQQQQQQQQQQEQQQQQQQQEYVFFIVYRSIDVALRRIMEQHSETTRFALACNSSTSVIEPLQSRCAILRFTKLTDAHLIQRLREVCAKENVTFTDDGIEAIVFSADGDMRSALNNLQSTVSGFGLVNKANVEKVIRFYNIDYPQKLADLVAGISFARRDELQAVLAIVGVTHMTMAGGLCTELQMEKMLAQLCKVAISLRPSVKG
ncbi:replication factor c subunit, putative [Eimeria mitis]|uniref:Replication factor c subunit, putative n=1 Tax=Eimeria mitis TaxID=44415 RepID=U6KBW4_9EIME|nr:replication factor c subunit, putative [Eimeria mitis]CDJ35419.1 replication factor c subunit, putative [Eimeria mitis]